MRIDRTQCIFIHDKRCCRVCKRLPLLQWFSNRGQIIPLKGSTLIHVLAFTMRCFRMTTKDGDMLSRLKVFYCSTCLRKSNKVDWQTNYDNNVWGTSYAKQRNTHKFFDAKYAQVYHQYCYRGAGNDDIPLLTMLM